MKLALSKLSLYDNLAVVFTFAALIATYVRLYFGVDFIDESYYVTLAYQYSLGAKPFVDDISPLIFATLTFPFVKIYVEVVGNSDGIMLFTRHLYFAFNIFTASVVFLATKKLLRWSTALLVALTCVVFIPFNIPNLSYNTMSSIFFTAGCFWGIWVIIQRKEPAYLFFAGLFQGLAVFSYPPLIIPSLIYSIILFFITSAQKYRYLISYSLGAVPVALLLVKIFLDAGASSVFSSLSYAQSLGYLSGWHKIKYVVSSLWLFYPYKFPIVLILSALYICLRKTKVSGLENIFLLFPLIPIPIIYSGYIQHCGCIFSMGYLFYYSLLAPYLLLFTEPSQELKKIFYLGWIPSFVAGFVVAYNSGNGYANAGLGMLSASIVTTIFLIKASSYISLNNNAHTNKFYRQLIAPFLVIFLLTYSQYQLLTVHHIVYLDADIHKLNRKVESGPFKGLYTTQEKKDYLAELSNSLNAVMKPGYKVLFYNNNFPAGYLLTSMRSALNVAFLVDAKYYSSKGMRPLIENYLRKNIDDRGVIAVKIKRLLLWDYASREASDKDFIRKIVEESSSNPIVSKENFSIYKIGHE